MRVRVRFRLSQGRTHLHGAGPNTNPNPNPNPNPGPNPTPRRAAGVRHRTLALTLPLGALLVYDIASRDTFTHVASWLRDARTLAGMDVSTVLIGNN